MKNDDRQQQRATQPGAPGPKTSQGGYGHRSSTGGSTTPQGSGESTAKANNARRDEGPEHVDRPGLEDTAEPEGQFPEAHTPGTWNPDAPAKR